MAHPVCVISGILGTYFVFAPVQLDLMMTKSTLSKIYLTQSLNKHSVNFKRPCPYFFTEVSSSYLWNVFATGLDRERIWCDNLWFYWHVTSWSVSFSNKNHLRIEIEIDLFQQSTALKRCFAIFQFSSTEMNFENSRFWKLGW